MPDINGNKTGGRVAGVPNKDRKWLMDELARKFPNYHPVVALAGIANDNTNDIAIRLNAHKEVAKYVSPQLKAIEVNLSESDKAIQVSFADVSNAKLEAIKKALDNGNK